MVMPELPARIVGEITMAGEVSMFGGEVHEVVNNGQKFYFCQRIEGDNLPQWSYMLKTNSTLPITICKPGNPQNHPAKVIAASLGWFLVAMLLCFFLSIVLLPLIPVFFLSLVGVIVYLVVASMKKVKNFEESFIDLDRNDVSAQLIYRALSTQSTFAWEATQHYLSNGEAHVLGEDSLNKIIHSNNKVMGEGDTKEAAEDLNEVLTYLDKEL